MKERIVEAIDTDDVAAFHLNAKHQVTLFYELFIDKKYADAALIGKALEISAKRLTRTAQSHVLPEMVAGQNAIISAMQEP
jgi:hypothetical protein